MNLKVFWKVLVCVFLIGFAAMAQTDKSQYYQVLAGEDESLLKKQLDWLQKEPSTSQNKAYQGALLMRLAEFQSGAGAKLKQFKSGMNLLETEIQKSPNQVEFRFLRLIIQEHAPPILKYNKSMDEDANMVEAGFANASTSLQTAIKTYAMHSKKLSDRKF